MAFCCILGGHLPRGPSTIVSPQAAWTAANPARPVVATTEEIATSAKEQATTLAEVNISVNQMDQVTQRNAAMVEQSTAASHALRGEARELAEITGTFQVGDDGVSTKTVPAKSNRQAEPAPYMASREHLR